MAESEIRLYDIGPFVPLPTPLLDEHLPRLKDTEVRIVLIVARQTLGWQSGQGRKRRDWMSQSQLKARTGRTSAALSAALDSLVRRNLIECSDHDGKLLLTPKQRRQHRGRVYFALSPTLWSQRSPHHADCRDQAGRPVPESETLSDSPKEVVPQRIYAGWTKAAVVAGTREYPKKSEVQKAKRTKETGEQKKL